MPSIGDTVIVYFQYQVGGVNTAPSSPPTMDKFDPDGDFTAGIPLTVVDAINAPGLYKYVYVCPDNGTAIFFAKTTDLTVDEPHIAASFDITPTDALIVSIQQNSSIFMPLRTDFFIAKGVYVVNTVYHISVTFKDDTGTLVNPSTVTFWQEDPNNAVTAISNPVTNPSTGVFDTTWEPTSGGDWIITCKGTNPDIHLPDQTLYVQPSIHA